jgi:hypothetical protein
MRRGTVALLACAALCLIAAGVGAYAVRTVLDEEAFADRGVHTLRSDEVRQEVAARAVERVVRERPELAPGQVVLERAMAEEVDDDPAFRAAFRDAAVRLHRALFAGADGEASLRVPSVRATVPAQVGRVLRSRTVQVGEVTLLTVGFGAREHALRRLARPARDAAVVLTVVFALLGAALLAAAIARERRRGASLAALAVAGGAGALAAGITAAQDWVLAHFDTDHGDAVVSTVWNAYAGDLRTLAGAVCAAALVVAAATGGPRVSLRPLAAPATPQGRALRAVGLLGAAALCALAPEMALHVGLIALSGVLFYVAVRDLVRVVAPPHRAARGLRAATTAAALLALIAVAAVPVAG